MKVQLIGLENIGKKTFVSRLDLKKGWDRIIDIKISNEVKECDFYLLMFDLTNLKSLDFIKDYINNLDKDKYLIVGNKSDMKKFKPDIEYIEISSRYNQNIAEPINVMIKKTKKGFLSYFM